MLNLVARHVAAQGSGLRLNGSYVFRRNVDGLSGPSQFQFEIQAVGLVGHRHIVVNRLLLKSALLDCDRVIAERKGAEGVVSARIAGRGHGAIGFGIKQGYGGSVDDGSLGVSDHSLNAGAVLRLGGNAQCETAKQNQGRAEKQSRTTHAIAPRDARHWIDVRSNFSANPAICSSLKFSPMTGITKSTLNRFIRNVAAVYSTDSR